MNPNCVTTTLNRLAEEGGRFVAAGSRRGPLMHVWHEACDGTVTRYEPDRALRHWACAACGYKGHTVDHPQAQARTMRPGQIVASAWVLAMTVTAWAVWRKVSRLWG